MSVIAARSQSAGRGQGDHTWTSTPGQNLTFTLMRRFPKGEFSVKRLADINKWVTSVLQCYLESHGVQAWVKPPNDIWVADKKICGILIENILDGEWVKESIIGIGLDINQTEWPDYLPNPVSLKDLTGKDYSLEEELEKLSALFCAMPL